MAKDMLGLEVNSWRRNTVVKAVMKRKLKQSQSLLQMWKPEILQDTSLLITNLANMPIELYLCAGRK